MKNLYKISFIGAGKVASALALATHAKGYRILKIISPGGRSASVLAKLCSSEPGSEYDIPGGTDLAIVSVPDHELQNVAKRIKAGPETLVVHTAGSYGMEVFPVNKSYRCGVLYPLQTFTRGRNPVLEDVPLFLEAETKSDLEILMSIASSLSSKVFTVDLETRRRMHLAAVFACNFVNHMLTAAESITAESSLDFNVFETLVRETIDKAFMLGPGSSQTGPAVRNDLNTIEKHLDLLSFSPQLKEVYKAVTESIIKTYTH